MDAFPKKDIVKIKIATLMENDNSLHIITNNINRMQRKHLSIIEYF